MKPTCVSGVLVGLMVLTAAAYSQSDAAYSINAEQSSIELGVFRGGMLKVFGHNHRIAAKRFSGAVHFNAAKVEQSSVTVSIESKSLTVLDPDVSAKERGEVQAAMEGPKVLNVDAFPKITFISTGVSQVRKAGEDWEITLAGRLNLHGVEKPITFPVRIHLENRRLLAKGEASVAQTEFGMTPIKIGGGAVTVKDRVKLNFNIAAERAKS